MATVFHAPRLAASGQLLRSVVQRPILAFWVLGGAVYGAIALHFGSGHFLDQASRDLWQHLAALRALIADPVSPSNPFVATDEGSRHFHPYWVSLAIAARAVGWNEWQALACGGFVSAGVLLAGIYAFGRAFYRSPWGPIALLAAMLLSWFMPISHTGYHSPETLIEGIAYPAALLVGLSLLLWAAIIRGLTRPLMALLVAPLTAFMLATHQLGAVIGFIGAGCFILLWPDGCWKARASLISAMLAGIALSLLWPYHSPIDAIAKAGNPTWTGGLDFYSPRFIFTAFFPSLIGLWGLLRPRFRRAGFPVLAAFCLFTGIFSLGPFGYLIATRFVMPAVLMLQIGVAALLFEYRGLAPRAKLGLFILACVSIQGHLLMTQRYLSLELANYARVGSAYDAALALTRDIPDGEPIAAHDVAAWPIVATGQRASSVPWPEPMIADLALRQTDTERLFDPALTGHDRIALARRWGVRTLVVDDNGPIRRPMPAGLIERLTQQSVRQSRAGSLVRFDLE